MYSVYLHVPFCTHRCAYCDFNTYAGQEGLIPGYVAALRNEIRAVADSAPEKIEVQTIFFGGGTPSLLSGHQFETILKTIRQSLEVAQDAEISLEANPGTLTAKALRELHAVGFNRISLGMQSAHPEELRQLERIHDYYDVVHAVEWARRAGFENLNLDLIFGLPEQTLERWQTTIQLALGLHPEHLSLYALTLEHGTPFGRWAQRGLLPLPDPDTAADMYEWAEETLDEEGYEHYEISNWAQPGRQCRHNLQYWRNLPYLGFGAGAHGFAGQIRYSNVLRIRTYVDRLSPSASSLVFPLSPSTVNHQWITPKVEMQETMITGLRLIQEGVSGSAFRKRFGSELESVFGKEIEELMGLGLLERIDEEHLPFEPVPMAGFRLRLTQRGHLLGNQVFIRFVDG
ncbi:MAG: radical SAM family heme chaperone HemW [Anaerolineales bacterium]|jgi:oxygen-independent coproporphyrinogen-3 oxidase